MRGEEIVDRLELDLFSSGVCLPCLTLIAFPLDSGDEAEARREARGLAPELWTDGLELTTMLALETASRDGVAGADEALDDVNCRGPRSRVVEAIVWRLAQRMVEDIRTRSEAGRSKEPPLVAK